MMRYLITIEGSAASYACSEEESLLRGMERLGKKGIPAGCRQGGCGVCKIAIVAGEVKRRVMSRAHVSEEDEANGRVLACRVFPRSDVTLRVEGAMKRRL